MPSIFDMTVETGPRKTIREIVSSDSRICPFCGSKDIFSGSWSPDKCKDCGAVYFFGSWWEE